MAQERLQKILARAGVASRRASEALITAGRVRVGGKTVTELGTLADPRRDRIEVDNRRIVAERPVYAVLHKPKGVVCTMRDPEGRRTVADLVRDAGVRMVPVGRLDYHTSGVLLLTNDGEFAKHFTHPSHQTPKTYIAKVRGVIDDEALGRWRQSIVIDGRATRPAEVLRLRTEAGKTWLEITLREGRNRQIRRLGDHAGHEVLRLIRSAFAGITSEGLRPGQWRYLDAKELVSLKRAYGVPKRPVAPPARSNPAPRGRKRVRASAARSSAGPRRAKPTRSPRTVKRKGR